MSGFGHLPAHHERTHWQWELLFVLTAAALVLGIVGFSQYEDPVSATTAPQQIVHEPAILNALYETLQLFVLHAPHSDKPLNGWLELARWFAAVVLLWTVIGALWRVYAIEWQDFLLGFSKRHIVICGAGWSGLALARDFRHPGQAEHARQEAARGEQVIVIDKDPDSPGLYYCQKMKIPYVVGDASDPRVLKTARVHRARMLIAACADDGTNLEIAIHARQLVEKLRAAGEALHCVVHLANMDLRTVVRQKNLVAESGKMKISTVGLELCENSARLLFANHPLDWRPINAASPASVHLMLIGLGEMSESVLIQAARIGHFANGKRLRVTVVDRDGGARETEFRSRYPQIEQICDLRFLQLDVRDQAVVELATKLGAEQDSLLTCIICTPQSEFNLALALKLGDVLKPTANPIRVWIKSRSGLGLLLSEARQQELFGEQIRPFGMIEDVCNKQSLERPELDVLARRVHQAYLDEQGAKGHTAKDNAHLVPWEALPEDLKDSNRHAADHIDIKLRAIGCHRSTEQCAEPLAEIPSAQLGVLANMEHARFCASRFLAGWRYEPKPKDAIRKTSPTLVRWNELPQSEKIKDMEQVQRIPQILGQAEGGEPKWFICPGVEEVGKRPS